MSQKKDLTAEQCKDAGLAIVLIGLLWYLFSGPRYSLMVAIVCLVVAMSAPRAFGPFARVWFKLSHVLGTIVSRIFLTLLFYLLVTPVGLLRRLLGKDSMQVKAWKSGSGSLFHVRDYTYSSDDLDHPY
jgi:multisubunit Na+/H+ antiporter MnhG subunit